MDQSEFFERLEAVEVDEEKIRKVWLDVVTRGKHSEKLQNLGKKYSGPKYTEPDNLKKTGSITAEEGILLCKLIMMLNVADVLEIGTWFGTSAAMMLCHCERLFSCDKHDVCVYESNDFEYYHGYSNAYIKSIKQDSLDIDMAFIDGQLYEGDAKRLVKMIKPLIMVMHDYIPDEKGWRAVEQIKKVKGNKIEVFSKGIMAFCIDKELL